MKKNINNSRIDEVLKILFLKKSNSSSGSDIEDTESGLVFSSNPQFEMPLDAKARLIKRLNEAIQVQSLGELIKTNAENQNVSIEELCTFSGLTENIVEDIQTDSIFPNSVPIHSLKKIFKKLQIGFEQGEKAIRKSFETLMTEVNTSRFQFSGVQPAFRRRNFGSSLKSEGGHIGSRANSLFRNEQSLNKYVTRLKELLED